MTDAHRPTSTIASGSDHRANGRALGSTPRGAPSPPLAHPQRLPRPASSPYGLGIDAHASPRASAASCSARVDAAQGRDPADARANGRSYMQPTASSARQQPASPRASPRPQGHNQPASPRQPRDYGAKASHFYAPSSKPGLAAHRASHAGLPPPPMPPPPPPRPKEAPRPAAAAAARVSEWQQVGEWQPVGDFQPVGEWRVR